MSVGCLRSLDLALFHPRHHGAELGAGLFNRMLLALLEQRIVAFVAPSYSLTQFLANLPD